MKADLIALSHSGNEDATLELINNFQPLLKKYAFILNYDDAYEELLIDFLELISRIHLDRLRIYSEGTIVSYIQKSIHHSYIKQSKRIKKLRNISLHSDLSESELYYLESATSHIDNYFNLDEQCFDHLLTKPESLIIKMIYCNGFSVSEIATSCGISRQAVNQTKKRALKKLENLFSDKLENK